MASLDKGSILSLFFYALIGFLLLGYPTKGISQDSTKETLEGPLEHQISFRHDNDLLMGTDRYYTAGLFITYKKRLHEGFFKSGSEQLSFALGQEMITPFEIETNDFEEMDRPYAGFLGINTGWSHAEKANWVKVSALFGVTGKISGAGSLQKWYHRTIISSDEPTWTGQIANSFHANLYFEYTYEWQVAPNPFSVYFGVHPQLAFGTRDVFVHPELVVHFGKRNPIGTSMAYKRIGGNGGELFFTIKAGYRFVGYNALLEGNALGDGSVFLVEPRNNIFHGGFDVQFRKGRNEYFAGYRIIAAETDKTRRHQYMVFSYARNF